MPASIATLTRLIDNEVIRAMGVRVDGLPNAARRDYGFSAK